MATEISFGAWMRRRRRQLDLTQEELANQAGCSAFTIRKLEVDERRPSKQLAERLALFLAIPADEQARFVAFARATQRVELADTPFLQESWVDGAAPTRAQAKRVDWGEAPDVTTFYGRMAEREQLRNWLLAEQCRLIALLGMGGIGKTTLATSIAEELQAHFDFILWRSLRNAPPLVEVVDEILDFLTGQPTQVPLMSVERRIGLLVELLRERRVLIVLDNVEAVLQAGKDAGYYRPGYEEYGALLQMVGERRHQGCFLITSREKPKEIARAEGNKSPVRSLALKSLAAEDGRALLADKGIFGAVAETAALSERYSGNPLALKVVAETIREVFAGDIGAFLQEETTITGNVRELLAAQFARLSALEQEVLLWLAVDREAVGPEELRGDILQPVSKGVLFDLLSSLRRRSLVEQSEMGFTLQNVVMEFLTDFLIEQVSHEIFSVEPKYLQHHALVKAQTKEYVHESQSRLLMQPVAGHLLASLGKEGLEDHLRQMLVKVRAAQLPLHGYAGGNILNLLLHLKRNLAGWDFSHLAIWQVHLRGVKVQNISFRHASFAKSSFTNPFGPCWATAFSPDGALVVAGTSAGEICVWRVADGELLLCFRAHDPWLTSLCFYPDGSTLATAGSNRAICLWDLPALLAAPFGEAQPRRKIFGHRDLVASIVVSPNGQLLASGGADGMVCLWEADSGICRALPSGHREGEISLCFSPEGERLASAGQDGMIFVWDVESGNALITIDPQKGRLRALCISPDGALLAAAGVDATIDLWELETGQWLCTLQGHTLEVCSLAFHHHGSLLASSSADKSIRLWQIETGECLHTYYGHSAVVLSVAFNPTGDLLASASDDQTLCVWDTRTTRCLRKFVGYQSWTNALTFSPDGHQLACGDALGVYLWNPHSGEPLPQIDDRTVRVNGLCYHPQGRLLAGCGEESVIRIWDLETAQCVKLLAGHSHSIWALSFHPDGNLLASCGYEYTVRLWEMGSSRCVELEGHADMCTSVSFSPDGRLLASGSADRTVRLWEMRTQQCVRVIDASEDTIWGVCFSPDSRILFSGGFDCTVRAWDVATGNCLHVLRGHSGWVMGLSPSPDGRLLASSSEDHTVRLWDVRSGECRRVLVGHTNKARGVCFSPDGRTLASSGDDQTIRLWDVASGECLRVLPCERPYEGMDITHATGLTSGQIGRLKQMGARADN